MAASLYLGIMSGTSLDGVDLALVDFAKNPPHITACECVPMPAALRTALSQLLSRGETSLQQLGELDQQLGRLYADCVNAFLARLGLTAADIHAIGCHGQTVWHAPTGDFPFTTQIGDLHWLAAHTGITTVGDFRRKDMAYGGQGAPLVPAFHQAVFSHPQRITGVLNIGGISNISLLIPNRPTQGYDVGAGNTLMDNWIERHHGQRFDENGYWAATGKVHQPLLAALLDEPFFSQQPPKSTGRELFNLAWLDAKLRAFEPIAPQDVQATLLELTVQCIAQDLTALPNPQGLPCLLLVCGGGAKNGRLMARLQALLPDWQVATTGEYGVDVDYVEAAAFAWLAYQRLHQLPSNLPSVTGASQAVSLGAIFTK